MAMTLGLRRSWLRLLAAGALALLAATVFAPGQARAECGDYLMIGGHSAAGHDKSPAKPAVPCPCQGPQCSQRPDLPLLPPAAPPSVAPAEWATMIARLAAPTNPGRDFLRDNLSANPIDRTDPIFHPPRLNG